MRGVSSGLHLMGMSRLLSLRHRSSMTSVEYFRIQVVNTKNHSQSWCLGTRKKIGNPFGSTFCYGTDQIVVE
ncbi:hypothetical protein OSTOST_10136, partial [Ostertagia ostertagi]